MLPVLIILIGVGAVVALATAAEKNKEQKQLPPAPPATTKVPPAPGVITVSTAKTPMERKRLVVRNAFIVAETQRQSLLKKAGIAEPVVKTKSFVAAYYKKNSIPLEAPQAAVSAAAKAFWTQPEEIIFKKVSAVTVAFVRATENQIRSAKAPKA